MSGINTYVDLTMLQSNNVKSDNICINYSKELKIANCEYIPFSEMYLQKKIGLPIYADAEGYSVFPMAHCFVFGSTGTGKSTVFFENTIRYLSDLPECTRPSMLVTDLKGEIYPLFASRLRRLGYNVSVFDMTNPGYSSTYNFLTQIFDDYTEAMDIKASIDSGRIKRKFAGKTYHSGAEAVSAATFRYRSLLDECERKLIEISEILIQCDDRKNLSWFEGARNCFVSVVLATLTDSRLPNSCITRENFTISSIVSTLLSPGDDNYETMIDWLKDSANFAGNDPIIADRIRMALSVYDCHAHVTRDGYLSTLTQQLKAFLSISVQSLTATSNELVPRKIASCKDRPSAIFILTNDSCSVTSSLSTLFINEMNRELTMAAERAESRSLDRPFVFLLDEFANMPAFPNVTGLVTTGRSRNIWVVMAIQSIEQITEKYGSEAERILWDNTGKIFLGINSVETKKRFAEEMGTKECTEYSAHIDSDGIVSYNVGVKERLNVSVNDLDSLKLGEFYVNFFRCPKLRSSMIPYFWRTDCPKEESWDPRSSLNCIPSGLYNGVREFEDRRRRHSIEEEDDDEPFHPLGYSDFLSRFRREHDTSTSLDDDSTPQDLQSTDNVSDKPDDSDSTDNSDNT